LRVGVFNRHNITVFNDKDVVFCPYAVSGFGYVFYSGECARKLGIAALIMAVLIIAGLILQRKREYYEYKKEDE